MSARNARGILASASQFGDGLQNTKPEVKIDNASPRPVLKQKVN